MYSQTPLFQDAARPALPARRRKPRPSALAEALAPYLDVQQLQVVLANYGRTGDALDATALQSALRTNDAPPEVLAMLDVVSAVLLDRLQRTQIRAPADVAGLLMLEMGHLDQEELRAVLLDTKNRVIGVETIYRGSVNSAMIRIGEVFKPALRVNAPAIILCHNHPSGDPTPSS